MKSHFFDGIPQMNDSIVDDLPAPTQEEGANDLAPAEDLDEYNSEHPKHVDITIDIDKNRTNDTVAAHQSYTEMELRILDKTDRLLCNIQRGLVAQEDIGELVTNGFYGVINVIGHIGKLFATYLEFGWRDFKRGETDAYLDNNVTLMGRLCTVENYNAYTMKRTPTPQGMTGTYLEAHTSLVEYLNLLDMPARMKAATDLAKDAYKQLRSQSTSAFNKFVESVDKDLTTPALKKAFDKTCRYFTTKSSEGEQFKKLFRDIGEFETVVENVRKADAHLREVAVVKDYLDALESSMNEIYEFADKLTPQQLTKISQAARILAESFDAYATCCNDIARVDHNIYIAIEDMRKFFHY